jgi:hypothetical protein
MIEIDRDIAMPEDDCNGRCGRTPTSPWRSLQVGDSFFIPHRRVISTGYWRDVTGFSFITRSTSVDGVRGVRVWRCA